MKKRIALVLAAVMLLSLFASGAMAEAEKPAKLTVWLQKTFSEEFNNAFANLFVEFGKENGIEVSAEIIDAAALRDTKLPAALESKELPNIAYMEPAALVPYAQNGILVSTDGVVAEMKQNGTEFYSALLDTTFVNGKSYAVPFSAQSWMLWYRKDLLEKAGYDHAPATWEEMLEMSKATTDPAMGIYGAGLAAGASASDFNNMCQSILWSYGGSVMKDGALNLSSEESKAGLQMLLKFFEEETVAPDMVAGDDMANNTAMLTGTACFIVNIPTIASALKKDAPDIWENTGCSPLPAGPAGSYPLAAVNMMSILDNGDAANEWAAKALAYACDKTRLAPILQLVAPAYGMVYADTMDNAEYMADPIVAAHMQAISTGKYYSYPDTEFTLARAALTASSTYINNIISYVVVEGMSFEDALAKEIGICEEALAAAK